MYNTISCEIQFPIQVPINANDHDIRRKELMDDIKLSRKWKQKSAASNLKLFKQVLMTTVLATLHSRRKPLLLASLVVILLLIVIHTHTTGSILPYQDKTHNCSSGSDFKYRYSPIGTDDNISANLNGPAMAGDDILKMQSENEFLVPNIVHYIWFADKPKTFKFHNMLSVLSAQKFMKPKRIFFHTNMPPEGEYWERVLKDVPEMEIVHRTPSTCLFGEPLKTPYYETSASNVDRIRVLLETGGIYLDLDVLVIRSFDKLRKFPCTIGMETKERACGGIIVCSKDSFFLNLWANAYLDNYRSSTWAYNTGIVPYYLSQRFPHLVHVETTRLHRPNYEELHLLWGKDHKYSWKDNYSVHLWYRLWKQSIFYNGYDYNYKSILMTNSTFAQIARRILD